MLLRLRRYGLRIEKAEVPRQKYPYAEKAEVPRQKYPYAEKAEVPRQS